MHNNNNLIKFNSKICLSMSTKQKTVQLLQEPNNISWANITPKRLDRRMPSLGEHDQIIKIKNDNTEILQTMETLALLVVQPSIDTNRSQVMTDNLYSSQFKAERNLFPHSPISRKILNFHPLKIDKNIELQVDQSEEVLKKTSYFAKDSSEVLDKEKIEGSLYQNQKSLYKLSLTKYEDCSIVNEQQAFLEGSKDPNFLTRFTQLKIDEAETTAYHEQVQFKKKQSQEEELQKQSIIVQHNIKGVDNGMVQKKEQKWEYIGAESFRLKSDDDKKGEKKETALQMKSVSELEQQKLDNIRNFEIKVGFDQRKVRQYKESKGDDFSKIFSHENQKLEYPIVSSLLN